MQTTELIRQMADNDLRLVRYHRKLVELQTKSATALNSRKSGLKGPIAVQPELLDHLLQLKFVEQIVTPAGTSEAVFQLTENGRASVREAG